MKTDNFIFAITYNNDFYSVTVTPNVSNFNPTKETALDLSLAKWKAIKAYLTKNPKREISDGGAKTCALCKIYLNFTNDPICGGCPVYESTGIEGCGDTPYQRASSALLDNSMSLDHRLAAVQAEIDFLESLKEGG